MILESQGWGWVDLLALAGGWRADCAGNNCGMSLRCDFAGSSKRGAEHPRELTESVEQPVPGTVTIRVRYTGICGAVHGAPLSVVLKNGSLLIRHIIYKSDLPIYVR